jgi:hypothetical protein
VHVVVLPLLDPPLLDPPLLEPPLLDPPLLDPPLLEPPELEDAVSPPLPGSVCELLLAGCGFVDSTVQATSEDTTATAARGPKVKERRMKHSLVKGEEAASDVARPACIQSVRR